MLSKTLTYISHHAIAILALVCSLLALAGASYAATQLPKNSVGNAQIQQGAVSPPKFSNQIGGYVRMYAKIDAAGRLSTRTPRPSSSVGRSGDATQRGHDLLEAQRANTLRGAERRPGRLPLDGPTSATVVGGGRGPYKTTFQYRSPGPRALSSRWSAEVDKGRVACGRRAPEPSAVSCAALVVAAIAIALRLVRPRARTTRCTSCGQYYNEGVFTAVLPSGGSVLTAGSGCPAAGGDTGFDLASLDDLGEPGASRRVGGRCAAGP